MITLILYYTVTLADIQDDFMLDALRRQGACIRRAVRHGTLVRKMSPPTRSRKEHNRE